MFSKQQLIYFSLVMALLFHFIFYFNSYGPGVGFIKYMFVFFFAFVSILPMVFVWLTTRWSLDFKDKYILAVYNAMILWMLICFIRSQLQIDNVEDFKDYLFSNYMGISLFPVFFLIAGINVRYFHVINRLLFLYLVVATLVSFFFLDYFELQLFLLFPIFYIIVTIPLRKKWETLLLILISISLLIFSFTNRAGILRIFMGYSIVLAYYFLKHVRLNRWMINLIVILILLIPIGSLYLGVKGQSVFQMVLGEDITPYSQSDPYADTRTFLYYEVFQDLKYNKAFLLGKGLNAGYMSESFQTYNRPVVEVAFLQILLKTGIVGFLLYITVIVSAIFKALSSSNNLFIRSLGLLLVSYVIMLFMENQIAYNLLNVIIWIIIGMCHSEEIRGLSDFEIERLFSLPYKAYSSVPKF